MGIDHRCRWCCISPFASTSHRSQPSVHRLEQILRIPAMEVSIHIRPRWQVLRIRRHTWFRCFTVAQIASTYDGESFGQSSSGLASTRSVDCGLGGPRFGQPSDCTFLTTSVAGRARSLSRSLSAVNTGAHLFSRAAVGSRLFVLFRFVPSVANPIGLSSTASSKKTLPPLWSKQQIATLLLNLLILKRSQVTWRRF